MKDITDKIRELYDSIMYFPNKVLEIFNDFFGEERVDMQEFSNFEEFVRLLSDNNLSIFFPYEEDVLNCPEFKSASKENKDIILDMLDNGALDCAVTSDETLATYFLPIMATTVSQKMKQGFILVHFPHVRVTNENDRFVDITHLWVKVDLKVTGSGVGYFTVNRSEYELSHMKCDYMHSHVSGIPFNDFTKFKTPCLGSGPIRSTVSTLAVNYDESIWQLFCLELDKYVRIESVKGTPYRYLERIGNANFNVGEAGFSMQMIRFNEYSSLFTKENMRDFIKHLIRSKKLRFNYIGGSYGFAMSYVDYRILISNEFIEWYTPRFNLGRQTMNYNDLVETGILKECIINNGKILYFKNTRNRNNSNYYNHEGAYVCTFKGKPVTVHIVDSVVQTPNKTVLLNARLAEEIARAVLEIVNYKYGREDKREEAGISTPAVYL